jgi:hypothetical protein
MKMFQTARVREDIPPGGGRDFRKLGSWEPGKIGKREYDKKMCLPGT